MRKLTKKQESEFRRAVKVLRASSDPYDIVVANNIRGGIRVFNYLFDVQNKIEKLAPKGFEVEPVGLTPKAKSEAIAFQWLMNSVTEKLWKARVESAQTTSQTRR
jgi:hypothetical protein